MSNDTNAGNYRPDTVTISVDEYADLIRAVALLDALLISISYSSNPLVAAVEKERNISRTKE